MLSTQMKAMERHEDGWRDGARSKQRYEEPEMIEGWRCWGGERAGM